MVKGVLHIICCKKWYWVWKTWGPVPEDLPVGPSRPSRSRAGTPLFVPLCICLFVLTHRAHIAWGPAGWVPGVHYLHLHGFSEGSRRPGLRHKGRTALCPWKWKMLPLRCGKKDQGGGKVCTGGGSGLQPTLVPSSHTLLPHFQPPPSLSFSQQLLITLSLKTLSSDFYFNLSFYNTSLWNKSCFLYSFLFHLSKFYIWGLNSNLLIDSFSPVSCSF